MARLLSRSSLQNQFLPLFSPRLPVFKHSLHTNQQSTEYFLSLLPFCRKSQDLKALNSLLVVHGLVTHQPLVRKFIDQCCHLGFPELALPAFETIESPNLYVQNLIIRSLSDHGLFEDVLFVYQKCRNCGFSSDNYTYPFVIKASAALRDVRLGNTTHCVALKTGFGENLVVQTALLDFYSKVGEMENACKLVDEMSQPDLVAWNALISGYSANGFHHSVLQAFKNMLVMDLKPNASTFANVLPVCSRLGNNDNIGTSLHGLVYKLGYTEEESLTPALISMYATRGDPIAARDIFDSSTSKNIAIWNAIMSAYTRNHKPENAIEIFQTMLLHELKPDTVTFVSLLPSLEILGTIFYVESFHTHVTKIGFEKDISVVTALISVYAKLGNINSAEFLFRNVSFRSHLLWNSMVSAYTGKGLFQKSLDAFRLMQMDGFVPDAISIVSLLSSCSELKAVLLGKSAHAFSIKDDISLNLNAFNAFLGFYCDCSLLAYSFRIFDRMVQKSVVSWNTMISGCVDNREFGKAMLLFHQMKEEVEFDLVTLISILPSCYECENPFLGLVIHSYAVKAALINDISLANALISMYMNLGEIDAARFLFGDMPDKDVVSWNAIFTGFRYHNLRKETIELFNQMIKEDRKPNYVTFLTLLPACDILLQGKSIHGYIIKRMVPVETPLLTSIMIMYARFENLTSCLTLFRIGDKTSISLWNTIISAYLIQENGILAFSYFRELLRTKIEPDDITVLNLVSSCAKIRNLVISNSALSYVVRKGYDNDVAIVNALIDLYAKCGSISSARLLFDDFPQKDTVSWSVMINGYGLHGDVGSSLTFYSEMKMLGLRPDKVTYMSILSACSHAGYVEQGRIIFDSMIRDGILAGVEHYACMVDLLGRTGHLNEAYEIIKKLPYRPSGNLLESLLGACLSHGNYSLGEKIGNLVLDMKPGDCGPYVILHNIYAAAGKWEDANNVRKLMEQNQLSKAAGFSLVDGNMGIC